MQVWIRIAGDLSDPNKVDVTNFMKTISWWQYADVDAKLKCKFGVFTGDYINLGNSKKLVVQCSCSVVEQGFIPEGW